MFASGRWNDSFSLTYAITSNDWTEFIAYEANWLNHKLAKAKADGNFAKYQSTKAFHSTDPIDFRYLRESQFFDFSILLMTLFAIKTIEVQPEGRYWKFFKAPKSSWNQGWQSVSNGQKSTRFLATLLVNLFLGSKNFLLFPQFSRTFCKSFCI